MPPKDNNTYSWQISLFITRPFKPGTILEEMSTDMKSLWLISYLIHMDKISFLLLAKCVYVSLHTYYLVIGVPTEYNDSNQ